MKRNGLWSIIFVSTVSSCAPVSALGNPKVVNGWPVPAIGGLVHRAPDGGFVTIAYEIDEHRISALAEDGTIRWARSFDRGCGNCSDGFDVARLRPDGTYGPIRNAGTSQRAVNFNGREVRGCQGAMLSDGTCITAPFQFDPSTQFVAPSVLALAGGSTRWEYREPGLNWPDPEAGGGAAPNPVVEDAGTAYTAFGGETPVVVALNTTTGTLLWRAPRPVAGLVWAAFDGKVLVGEGPNLVLIDRGTERWSTVFAPAARTPIQIDRELGLIYLQNETTGRVSAIDLATGSERWNAKARLLGPSQPDGVFLATGIGREHLLEARRPDGTIRYTYATATRVGGALTLGDGTVVVTQDDDLAIRFKPGTSEPPVRRNRVRALHRSFAAAVKGERPCGKSNGACIDRRIGTILRLELPRPAEVTVQLLSARPARGGFPAEVLLASRSAPHGTSFVRILRGLQLFSVERGRSAGAPPGPYTLRVRLRSAGASAVRNIPVQILASRAGQTPAEITPRAATRR